jgi:hypothetical protein
VQAHVEQGELELAHELQPGLEVLRRDHLVEQRARDLLAGPGMARHVPHHVPLPAEVLHELAGQLHRVPLHAVQPRDAELVDLREQQVQAVPELVEERGDLVVREERGLAVDRTREVAREVRDRRLHARGKAAAVDRIVHPRPAALAFARIEVEVEAATRPPDASVSV